MKRTSAWRPIPSPARPRPIWCLALLLLLCAASSARAEVTIADDQGRTIALAQPARRVIALYGAFNEILDGLGLADRIVARTSADRLPASIAGRPVIGTHMRPNVELVLAMKPDLVLQMAGRKEASLPVEALRRRGVPVAVFHAANFEELFSVIARVGVLTGAQERAEAMNAGLRARLDALDRRLSGVDTRPSVFYEVRSPNMLAAGRRGMVSQIIERAGGRNCVEERASFARLGEEEVLRLDPDVYLIQQGPMNPSPLPLAQRPRLRGLRAAKSGRVHVLDEQKFARPGPRNVDAAEELAALLHPQAAAPAAGTPKSKKMK